MSTEILINKYCPELSSLGFDVPAIAEMMETRYLGEFEIFGAAAGLFIGSYEGQLNDIKAAIESMDPKSIKSTAHKYKGAIANFHDPVVVETARAIETNSDKWSKEQFLESFNILTQQTAEFLPRLNQLVESFSKIQQEAA
ncbi:Hpt domain-containing protein [Bdellovibrio sp. HCB209]|uniref:Hpt domain-containing protein n=1 Tax=Bdellovibrio sp. HCB209 TaxID=3394354 RepID=UPI0039B581D9